MNNLITVFYPNGTYKYANSTIEEQRFSSILNEISGELQQTIDDDRHPKNLSISLIKKRISSTIKPVLLGKYRTNK